MKTINIRIGDLPEHRTLDTEELELIEGGRINLDPDAKEKRQPPPGSAGAGGMLHPGDNSTNIWWWHAF